MPRRNGQRHNHSGDGGLLTPLQRTLHAQWSEYMAELQRGYEQPNDDNDKSKTVNRNRGRKRGKS